jgi:hypothetical protein
MSFVSRGDFEILRRRFRKSTIDAIYMRSAAVQRVGITRGFRGLRNRKQTDFDEVCRPSELGPGLLSANRHLA